ncbi:MAG: menaquinone biosynthetic enzyme MqnA/MqnD family protein [Verrucomicrobiia bacterium]
MMEKTGNDHSRIGSVPYLNALPLTRGLESELRFGTPAHLATWLRDNKIDAALVSVVEVLQTGQYDLLDGIALASDGPVWSVLLAHRVPLDKVTVVYLDPASLTSTSLVRVLLAERGLRPEMRVLRDYRLTGDLEAVLLIGNRALDFVYGPHTHSVFDLGEAWQELTGLPFVYAGWALRRGIDQRRLSKLLRQGHANGMAELDRIIAEYPRYDAEFREMYLRTCMRFELGDAEKAGLARFGELLVKHGLGPVHQPRFVD